MDQITKTVNSFLAFIVGIGLICFFSFIFLLASAQLNDSLLGTLLADVAGETARTARTESFSYWGRVGGKVAAGLGYGPQQQVAGSQSQATPVVVVVGTTPAPVQGATATPVPTNPIRSSALSDNALLSWRGLDANSQRLPLGVNLEQVRQQAELALQQNSGDMLAVWLTKRVQACDPTFNQLRDTDYRDPTQAASVNALANALIAQCNPRLFFAYARSRWADITTWLSNAQPQDIGEGQAARLADESQASRLLAGLTLSIGEKVEGPARDRRLQDHVNVTILPLTTFGLDSVDIQLTVGTLNTLLGENKWDPGGTYNVPGEFFPVNPPEPALPSDADLATPVAPAVVAPVAESNVQSAGPGKYVVQSGDTVYSIARKFNVAPDALVNANPTTLGANPNYIVPGQELNIPTP